MTKRLRNVAIACASVCIAVVAWTLSGASSRVAFDASDANASEPSARDAAMEVADAATQANGSIDASRVEAPAPDEVTAVGAGVGEGDQDRYHFRVHVVDASDRGVQHATVWLGTLDPWHVWQMENTDQDGRAKISVPRRIGPINGIGIVASLAGVTARGSLEGCKETDEIELELPAMGWFSLTVDGPLGNVGAQIVEWDGHETFGHTTTFLFDEPTERVAVGLGSSYSVTVWSGGERDVRAGVVGPKSPDEVVPLAFDFRRCAVKFEFAPDASHGDAASPIDDESRMAVHLLEGKRSVRCDYSHASDGTWTALVPRSASARLVITSGATSYETEPMSFGESVDLGRVALQPMKDFGVVEARMPDGTIAPGRQWPSAFVHADGTRMRASNSTGSLFVSRATYEGARIASLRMFAAVEVVARAAGGHYADPAVVTLTGASRAQVAMLAGAVVEILAVDVVPVRRTALVHRATGDRESPGVSIVDEGRPKWIFGGLPPGDYDVRIDGMSSSPSSVHVPAGSKQRVMVVLTEK